MTETNENVTWLTQEAYDRLSSELEYLSGPGRSEIARKIEAAREEGDLRENGGYHAAKEEQGKQEGRIRQLTHLLRTAQVGEASGSDGVARSGTVVTIRFAGDDGTERFLLGSRESTGTTHLDVYSEKSPLGAAVLGSAVGESVSYKTPTGASLTVEVVEVEPFTP
ncbi:MAG: transcription elongation factor GreA [Actinomycetes bacterium]